MSYDLVKTLEELRETPEQKKEKELKKYRITPAPKFREKISVFNIEKALREFRKL